MTKPYNNRELGLSFTCPEPWLRNIVPEKGLSKDSLNFFPPLMNFFGWLTITCYRSSICLRLRKTAHLYEAEKLPNGLQRLDTDVATSQEYATALLYAFPASHPSLRTRDTIVNTEQLVLGQIAGRETIRVRYSYVSNDPVIGGTHIVTDEVTIFGRPNVPGSGSSAGEI